jgi:beta-glucosidase
MHCTMQKLAAIFLIAFGTVQVSFAQDFPFLQKGRPIEERVENLLSLLTLEEKVSLLGYDSKGVPRLGIPKYNWWNEGLHGVARAGEATIFPQAIGLAATFNDTLVRQIADVISTEARAKFNLATKKNRRIQYMGLTFWSPNINIFRDPRWGRGQETYGEDPFLTASMGVAFVKGLQGNGEYLKAAACAKHFAVHSGPEAGRHSFNAHVDDKDLRETYLYAFQKVVAANVESVMCAYNRLNNEPCCTSKTLLGNVLFHEWKFDGHLVTDCGALYDIFNQHKVMNDAVEVAAAAVKAGVSIDCSDLLQLNVLTAVERKLISESDINKALAPALRTQFKLGFYDANKHSPFDTLGEKDVHSKSSVELSRIAAQQSMVLLKNSNNLLPLKKEAYNSILVTGSNAASANVLFGNYHGMSSQLVTFAEGITKECGPDIVLQYDMGSDYTDTTRFGGLWVSENSDLTIAVIGLTPVLEGEEGDAFLAPNGGDRRSIEIPRAHIAYMRALRHRHEKPIIAVVNAGSSVDISSIEPFADAIILAWYPGEQGGTALADILFGKVSPAGRLPITFYSSLQSLPPYDSYSMQGRTYRYFKDPVQYPFGFGLSYTNFSYQKKADINKNFSASDTIKLAITIANTGTIDSDEVVQAYVKYPQADRLPFKELKAFDRIHIPAGTTRVVTLRIPVDDLKKWNLEKNRWETIKGTYRLFIGGNSNDERLNYSFRVR